ncbi:DUF1353 domain-containing protein [Helicobacter bizzozeronii]|uniref:DUF1353 domain-containing protein n=1 Tax=Helicobacter bizzozeronii TaxID=56877 RepID=UPI00244D8862|nr:DUF1353 domain-containing protein [Helicobacter bizzozeronii]GMB93693.1 DUF1353 domain-containing protein [Helicobacter bizzozeronii]
MLSLTLLKGFKFVRYVCKNSHLVFEEIIVPAGFSCDGFTNLGLNQLVPKFGKGLKCAILHDYLCEQVQHGKHPRKYADDVFLEAMLETKAFAKFKAYFLYGCVRGFGIAKAFLNNYKKRSKYAGD